MLSEAELFTQSADDYMSPGQLEFFAGRLQARALELRERILLSRSSCDIERHPDAADFASDEEARSMAFKMIERDRLALDQVLQALELIRLGDYGFCHETGEPIGLERLLLVPESFYSVETMSILEVKGRHQVQVV